MTRGSGAPRSSPISWYTICARGQKVTSSSNGLERPARTFVPSPRPATNSSVSRLLPIPGSPRSVTRCARSRLADRSKMSFRSASSRRRSTNGIRARSVFGRARIPRTGRATRSSSNPFARSSRWSPNSTKPRASCTVVSPARISPGSAACWRRAPALTSAPITMLRSVAVPTATGPVLTPIRTCIGKGRSSWLPSRSARSRTDHAARIARTASSSRATGIPKTPRTASPMNPSATPPTHAISSATIPWYAARTSRNRSGSRRDASWVDPARSTNATVTIRRSAAAWIETGAPQFGQKFASAGSGSPQRGQTSALTVPGCTR